MKKIKTKIHYCGGTIPVPAQLQKGTIEIKGRSFCIVARGKSAEQSLNIRIPLENITKAVPVEKKYYSSVGYFLQVSYMDVSGNEVEIELEVRCFIRRGRTQALMQYWADTLSVHAQTE